jgi:hypothetical protein
VLVGLVDHLAARVAERPDRRDVHDLGGSGLQRATEHVLGPDDVGLVHGPVFALRDPDLVNARAVDGGIDTP